MTTEDFDQAVNGIRPEMIEEAANIEPASARSGRILKFAAVAAALVLCAGASILALPYLKPSGGNVPETTAETGIGAGGVLEDPWINLGKKNISLTTITEAKEGKSAVQISEADAKELVGLLDQVSLKAAADPKLSGVSEEALSEGYVIFLEGGDTVELLSAGYLKIGDKYFTDADGHFDALYEKTGSVLSAY
ncbi:MAG: hypothetical protein J5825_11065 [Lachnospiraceae bacterium]|nr:hypothetical protein [Lachnospiraceae bacterium]